MQYHQMNQIKVTSRYSATPVVAKINKTTDVTVFKNTNDTKQSFSTRYYQTENLHGNVKEIDIYELFGLKTTTYLRFNCSVHILQLQSNGRRKRYAYIKSPVYVFSEVIKLNGVKFHDN